MPTRRAHSTVDLAPRERGGLHRADGNSQSAGPLDASWLPAKGKDVEELMATLRKEHDRAERRLGAALAEQRRSTDRNDAAVGLNAGPFELLAEDSGP